MANKKIILTISSIVVIVIVALLFFLLSSSEDSVLSGKKVTEQNLLKGDWVRTDASYLIRIKDVKEGGTLEARYYNPNPINVETASWEENYGDLKLRIVLRDVNYPGSRYILNYLQDRDILAGEYFQAVEGLTFYVEFARYKAGLRRN